VFKAGRIASCAVLGRSEQIRRSASGIYGGLGERVGREEEDEEPRRKN
jgi:hypothetical protein